MMFTFSFDSPGYLVLLVLVPLLWIWSFRSLAGLGRVRRIVALLIRTSVLVGFILALAEIQWVKVSERLTVVYLLDQSESIPQHQRSAMLAYVRQDVAKHRNDEREDRAGVIIFGREALIEIPPFDDDIHGTTLESSLELRRDATNLESALKLAEASFAEDSAKRVVIVTDGNENLGDARTVANQMASRGIGIDVVPIRQIHRREVAVEKVAIPNDVRRGQPFEATVVLNNFTPANDPDAKISGKMVVTRSSGRRDGDTVSEQAVTLAPGKNVYRLEQKIDQPAAYTYKVRFVPDKTSDDLMPENNEATAFSHIRGKGRVLMIVDWQSPNDFDHLADRLRAMNVEVDKMSSDQLFTSLAELQGYDSVILADVPRSSGDAANNVTSFSDEQIKMLVRNTEQMGCGLVMLGGPNSFGAGGWANTELEKAMPVDFQIKNEKIQAVGALVMMMHASEMAEGNHWQKVVGGKSVEMLGPMDYAGVIQWGNFTGKEEWLWAPQQGGLIRVGQNKRMMLSRIDKMIPGDMPDFEPSMRMALRAFQRVNASVKHMIVISDGDPSPPGGALLNECKKAGVQVSTVAIGTHGPPGSTPLQHIATVTGGKYYVVRDAKALPSIYQREVRRIARPVVKDLDNVPPRLVGLKHEMLQGIAPPFPPLKGFVMTTVKENPLVEVSLISPEPSDHPENATILASWTYGLGRTAVFTTDAGNRWASDWKSWADYDKFFSQMIRWSMRPLGEQGKFTVATNHKDGKLQVIVTALDEKDEFKNFLQLNGAVISPELTSTDVRFQQVAPGRYVAEMDASKAGTYLAAISPGAGQAPILAGVSVPYSAEFRERETNLGLLTTLANYHPKDGQPGTLIDGELSPEGLDVLLKTDTFRHTLAKATSSQAVWPLAVLLAACVFFADVFVRRVTIHFDWLWPILAAMKSKLFRQEAAPVVDERMERLRSKKAAVAGTLDERRAAARFAPEVEATENSSPRELDTVLNEATAGTTAASTPSAKPTVSMSPTEAEQDTYTARLLKAKEKARRENRTGEPGENS